MFLLDNTCLNTIQVNLKLYEDTSSPKVKFSKDKPDHAIIDYPEQVELSQLSIKIFGVNFGNSILNNSNWDTISEGLIKHPYLEQSQR